MNAGALLSNRAPLAGAQSSIYGLVNSTAELSLLKRAIDTAGLADALSDPTLAQTVFAPNNDVSQTATECRSGTLAVRTCRPCELAVHAFAVHLFPCHMLGRSL